MFTEGPLLLSIYVSLLIELKAVIVTKEFAILSIEIRILTDE
jgi:hypothetical protein